VNLRSLVRKPNADEINTAAAANLANVIRWSTPVSVVAAGAAAAVVVAHNLGVIPNVWHVEPHVDSRWWIDPDDPQSETQMAFRTAHAGVFEARAGIQ